MIEDNIKTIKVHEISIEAINQITKDYIDNIIQDESNGIKAAKNSIQIECEKITLNFVELIQLYEILEDKNERYFGTNLKYQFFKSQFNQVMQNTRFGFFEFVFEAWSKVMQTIYLVGDKRIERLILILLGEINVIHNNIIEENKKYSKITQLQSEQTISGEFKIGNYILNSNSCILKFENEVKKLTTKETQLLQLLVLNKNEVVLRTDALKSIWHDSNYKTGRSMDVYITKLRRYLKNDKQIEILNVHGKGFKLLINIF